MSNLPTNVAFRRYGYKDTFVGSSTDCLYVSAEPELIVNPKARFIVVPSVKHDGLIHIKSYYTNKFWRSEFQESRILASVASEPVEDSSSWNSTLFRVQYHRGCLLLFYHCPFNHNNWVGVKYETKYNQWVLYTVKYEDGQCFLPINTDYIVRLPKRVTFNKDDGNNGRWILCGKWQEGHPFHEFVRKYKGQSVAEYEIFYNEDGDIRVKSVYYGKFWRRSPNWIWADSNDTTSSNPDTVFQVVPLDDNNNFFALRNKGNNHFCTILNLDGKYNCLNAHLPEITREAELFVSEPVLSRDIEVHFRLKDATRAEKTLHFTSVTAHNPTDRDQEIQKTIKYTKTKTTSWSTTLAVKTGVKANIKSGLPSIVEGKIEVSAELSAGLQFGESHTLSEEISTTFKAPVPAKTKAIVKLLATQAEYDIPFSYTQTDTRYDGNRVSTTFEDGMYHGVESYNFYYDTKYEKL